MAVSPAPPKIISPLNHRRRETFPRSLRLMMSLDHIQRSRPGWPIRNGPSSGEAGAVRVLIMQLCRLAGPDTPRSIRQSENRSPMVAWSPTDCDGPDPLKTDRATGWLKGCMLSIHVVTAHSWLLKVASPTLIRQRNCWFVHGGHDRPTWVAAARPLASPLPCRFSSDRAGRNQSIVTCAAPCHQEVALESSVPRNKGTSVVRPCPWNHLGAGSESPSIPKGEHFLELPDRMSHIF